MILPKKILFLANTNHNADCVHEHIAAVKKNSDHHWFVMNALKNRMLHKLDLNNFDAVGFHYSIHHHETYYCPQNLFRKIRDYRGAKFLFLQDEYENVNSTSEAMAELGIDILFTCIRPEYHRIAYKHAGLKNMERVTVMAGYAPDPVLNYQFVPLKDRNVDIFYRSRVCPLNAGSLGYEKSLIAGKVEEKGFKYGLKMDISVREEDRVYGEEWVKRLSNCRATLGTESGASIWDWDGSIANEIDHFLGEFPNASFEELFNIILNKYDGKIPYSSISPRIFEAAALKTPQILFPGWYNELIKPGVHYFELKKDFSNFDKMLEFLRDDEQLSEIAENAYNDLILSKLYNSESLGSLVNKVLTEKMKNHSFESNKTSEDVQIAIQQVEKNYKISKLLSNLRSEMSFGFKHFVKIIFNPRYRGLKKFRRLYEIFLRYCTHLKPRLCRQ